MVQESTIDLNRIKFRKKYAARPKNEKRRGGCIPMLAARWQSAADRRAKCFQAHAIEK
jgi:hypothetical protein